MEQFQQLKAMLPTSAAKTTISIPAPLSERATPASSGSGGVKRPFPEEVHSSASSVPSKQQCVQLEQTAAEKVLPGIVEGELVGETPHDIAPEERNSFEHHPQIRSETEEPEYDLAGRLILPRNPMVIVLDEARQFDFDNLTSRVLGVAEETHRLVDHHKRLAAAREKIRRSNVRLKLANEDLHQKLARKDELIRQMQESHAAELRKVREKAALSVSKEVLE